MDPTYINKIREWVEIDNVVLAKKEEISTVSIKKKELEEDIIEYVENKKLEKLSITISDGTIDFYKKTQSQALSIKLLKNILSKYEGRLDPEEICDFVKENLEKKTSIYMKRNFKDD